MKKILYLGMFWWIMAAVLLGENRALIVGVSDYGHLQLNINGPDQDVELMKEVAIKLGFLENQTKVLLNQGASRQDIIKGIDSWIVRGVGPEDTVLFYFSGHGMQVTDENGDEDDGCDEAIVPADFLHSKGQNLIVDDELNVLLRKTKAKHILVFLDSCFSGTATRGGTGGEFSVEGKRIFKSSGCRCNQPLNIKSLLLTSALSDKRMMVFTASGQNEVALGGMKKGEASVFTKAIHTAFSSSRISTFAVFREHVALFMRTSVERYGLIYHTPYMECDAEMLQAQTLGFAAGGRVPNRNPSKEDLEKEERIRLLDRLVNNSRFKVHMVNRQTHYRAGERISFRVTASKAGYLNVIELDPSGKLVVLFPNSFAKNNRVEADQKVFIPEGIGGFEMVAQAPYGASRIFALVTSRPLNMLDEPVGQTLGRFKTIDEIESDALLTRAVGIVSGPQRLPPHAVQALSGSHVEQRPTVPAVMPFLDPNADFGAAVLEIFVKGH